MTPYLISFGLVPPPYYMIGSEAAGTTNLRYVAWFDKDSISDLHHHMNTHKPILILIFWFYCNDCNVNLWDEDKKVVNNKTSQHFLKLLDKFYSN